MKNQKKQKTKKQNNKSKPRRQSTPKSDLLPLIAHEFPAEILQPKEAFQLLFGRVETLRRIIKAVRYRLCLQETGFFSLPPPLIPRNQPAPPRPTHVLSPLNRSKVHPPLVSEQINYTEVRIDKVVERIRIQADEQSACQWLDVVATASGLSLEICARLLQHDGIVKKPFDKTQIAATSAARRFWTLYGEGRAVRHAKVVRENSPRWRDDFAFFTREGLEALLPGIILPDHFRRLEFLTNYVIEADGACLDLYNAAGIPLVRHPFLSA